MDISEIKQSILALRAGTITDPQRQQLEQWIAEDVARRELVDSLCDEERVAEDLNRYASFDPDRAWKSLTHKRRTEMLHRRTRQVIRYAAIVVLVVTVSFAFHQFGWLHHRSIGEIAGIRPGSVRATLIVDHSETIELEGLRDTAIYYRTQNHAYVGSDGLLKYQQEKTSHEVSEHTIATPRGGEYKLVLSDGTVVRLNSDSRLSYPAEFPDSVRRVKLVGEAYFEVAKDPTKRFIVETNDMSICALGTAFNVSAYSEDNYVATTLVEGKVLISTSDGEAILKPGEQGVVESNSKLAVEQISPELYANWTEERFVFERESIDEVMKRLARWYNFNYEFASELIMEKHFTGKLPKYSDIDQVFSIIELTTDIHFKLKDKTIIIN